ncbi:hypothetical protein DDB_G0272648 [Dictyostelium discoideum AX4]|uniref:Uncharacterized protein n=1 Tax=Dictyostelium discoideum TaxID=44689 RepID=Q556H6_DICDI|nr:hypothetical protein DDB_G0274055 [Dictyostelium discoideum AX4]XP_645027.1 hypothetical protein DDB_G0272648 [Dictyostelium discoideum AX4]EAL70461.1 hypothetical protein DDB_G0274055 [Dictyostelium discoideum AX4]EAL70961.1 hypothetical protein DDB_G0272648 [Dictyostelium discoideum AX4]|eukprot:XP_644386.1 hypothetical protein DDB_G0274055 [Dictyostelium discoideum AX4]
MISFSKNFNNFISKCRFYTKSNNISELNSLFPKIEFINNNETEQPFYRLKKPLDVEVPRIGCNPLKRLDKNLTRPIKQLLIVSNDENNKNECFKFMTQIGDLKLSLDINSLFFDNKDNSKLILNSVLNQLTKIPIIISNDSNSSDKIIEFLENESNPIFPFVVLNSPNKDIKKFRNLSDTFLILKNNNNKSNNINLVETIILDSNNSNDKILEIIKKRFEDEM